MRTELRIEAEAGAAAAIHAVGGLTARRTGPRTVHLIGTAATPLGGDQLDIVIAVGPGARLVVRSVAASIALPGPTTALSTSRWFFDVAAGAVLDFAPEPMIVAANAEHHARTIVRLAADGELRLREQVQIGRAEEDGGHWRGDLHADLADLPMLRHTLELGDRASTDDRLTAPRALVSELRYPDSRDVAAPDVGTVLLPLAAGGTLSTRLGPHLPFSGA